MRDYNFNECDVEHINNIIKQAISHGGDAGGAYFSNEKDLLVAIGCFMRHVGLTDNYTLVIGDDDCPIIAKKIEESILNPGYIEGCTVKSYSSKTQDI